MTRYKIDADIISDLMNDLDLSSKYIRKRFGEEVYSGIANGAEISEDIIDQLSTVFGVHDNYLISCNEIDDAHSHISKILGEDPLYAIRMAAKKDMESRELLLRNIATALFLTCGDVKEYMMPCYETEETEG